MNTACKDLRNSLAIETLSSILFIKINGPLGDKFLPENFFKIC